MDCVKVSVIIATYNTAEYIEECLDSVAEQTLKQIEIIIIDDGSTDNTQELLEKYIMKHENILVVSQNNTGAGLARNKGIELAKGEYMVFMDPDDKYPVKDCLEILYNTAKTNDVLICGGNILGNDNGKIVGIYSAGDGTEKKIKDNIIKAKDYFYLYGHQRYIFKSEFIKKEKIKYAQYKRYEDQILTVDAIGKAGSFYELDYPVYEYRINYRYNKFDKNTYLDIVKGFRDTIKLICLYNMGLMYEKNCQNFIKQYMPQICRYRGDGAFDAVIKEINSIMEESGWSDERDLITQDRIEYSIKNYQNMKSKLDTICEQNKRIIIYGAGKNTKVLLEYYGNRLGSVIGIAVTEENDIDKLGDLEVRAIDKYLSVKEEALVLVTPSFKVKDAIFSVLDKFGFKQYEWIDVNFVFALD